MVQVNGKVRGRFETDPDTDEESIKKEALLQENVVRAMGEKPVRKIICVKKKLVNIVV